MATKKKTKTKAKKAATKKKTSSRKKAPAKKATTKKKATKKKTTAKKAAAPKPIKKTGTFSVRKGLSPKPTKAVKAAAEALWEAGEKPHTLLQDLHETLLLRCLDEAEGNYAGAAALFGPSRQSVQQYANSPLRDSRWKQYQQNRRKKRG